jgi:hypothetical protein
MTWWVRFCLGLPARREDVEELRRSLPELFDAQLRLDEQPLVPWWPSLVVRELTVEDLRRWARAAAVPTEAAAASPENCPAEECPLRRGPRSPQVGDVAVLRLMVAGGAHKPPKDEFLDLVRRVHRGQAIREVILTDPYIYLDLSEQRQPSGYGALIDYLRALRLARDSHFELKLNPSPKKVTTAARRLLERKVKDTFPSVRLGTFPSRHRFHDRFYLTRDQSGRLSGIFGPSLNGLATRTIVLMGELENGALQRLGGLV